ncbi:RNA-binding domain-containing protein [Amniculicola lignicola CBS 123094]|uniref:RNA-binding domain-containing protein n=1 Tax=Amniculicola lignicola CBS 123094 TaxID=1392246 RepID=A0A6A5WQT2_9PLEO|nr:RNA-binding domain-containing protein [Amniculicola lignicola CBS 123094]
MSSSYNDAYAAAHPLPARPPKTTQPAYPAYPAQAGMAPATSYSYPSASMFTGQQPSYPSMGMSEEDARIAQWNSAYVSDNHTKKTGANDQTKTDVADSQNFQTPAAAVKSSQQNKKDQKPKTVIREGGGKKWEDPSLLEWNIDHPRLFIGNLAGEVTDDSLFKAFSKYESVSKARVIRDKTTTKSKGYGFVSFANSDEYFSAYKEMQGQYIGSHPVRIDRAAAFTATAKKNPNHQKGKGKGRYDKKQQVAAGPIEHNGIQKPKGKSKQKTNFLG